MIATYYEHSRVSGAVRQWRDLVQSVARGYDSSRLKQGVDWLEHVTRESWLVRWLTADPDPDVVVIDLTETWTVGPIIEFIDVVLPHGERAWRGAGTRRLADRTSSSFESAPVQVASSLVLGFVVARLALSWSSASRGSLALLCFLAAPALLGLRVDWTWDELVESRVGQLLAALLVPPESQDDVTR